MDPLYNNKWVRRFMRRAREICESVDCASRNVGCVLVKDKISIADGFNGPPPNCKKNSSRIDYQDVGHMEDGTTLKSFPKTKCDPYYDPDTCKIVCPIYLHYDAKSKALNMGRYRLASIDENLAKFFDSCDPKNLCPRKLLGYKSGEGLGVCNCNCAESNAISFAARNGHITYGASAFVYPLSPCKNCSGSLISAGIKEIYCLEMNEYNDVAKIILEEASVRLFLVKKELLDLNPTDPNIHKGSWVTPYK